MPSMNFSELLHLMTRKEMVPIQNTPPEFKNSADYCTPERIFEATKDLPNCPKTEECPSYNICNDVSSLQIL